MVEKLLTVNAVSEIVGLAPGTLAKRRLTGDGPPFIKLGARVLYPEADLRAWMTSQQRFDNTAQLHEATRGTER